MGAVWMFAYEESSIGSKAGVIAGTSARLPHFCERWETAQKDKDWVVASGITVLPITTREVLHDELCNKRAEREMDLSRQADEVLKRFHR